MKKTMKYAAIGGVLLVSSLFNTSFANALDIVLEPATAQREIGGKVRVHVYADGATSLVSQGVKISFNKDVLQVFSASKYEDGDDGWTMQDASGTAYPTPNADVAIDNTNGSVSWLAGYIRGDSTVGLSGKVLLGWVVFEAIGNGNSDLHVDLGKYHPEHPTKTFDNFVRIDTQSPDEPMNVPGNLGVACVGSGGYVPDYDGDGDVDSDDLDVFKAAFGSVFGVPNYNPAADSDGDGDVDSDDLDIFKAKFGHAGGTVCN